MFETESGILLTATGWPGSPQRYRAAACVGQQWMLAAQLHGLLAIRPGTPRASQPTDPDVSLFRAVRCIGCPL
jgi:hypothetical protein